MLKLSFDYMYMNNIIATVSVDGTKVSVLNYTTDKMDRPFGWNDSPTIEDLNRLFEYRCVPEGRYNIKQLLKEFPQGYDMLSIIRKTHGIMSDDYYWIRFNDEKNLTWEDVKHWKFH